MDNLHRPSPGEPFRRSASDHNRTIAQIRRALTPPAPPLVAPPWPLGPVVWLHNTGGSTIPRFAWCEITAPAEPHSEATDYPNFAADIPWVNGALCSSSSGPGIPEAYAVAQDSIPADAWGLAITRGITYAQYHQASAGSSDGNYLDPSGPHITLGRAKRASSGPGRIITAAGSAAGDNELAYILLDPLPVSLSTQPPAILTLGYCRSANTPEYTLKHYTSTTGSNIGGFLHFSQSWGDLAGNGVTIAATNASVTAGTHARSDPAFKLAAGLYRFILWLRHADSTGAPAYTTETKTTSNASAGTPHTHTVNVREEHALTSSLSAYLTWRASTGLGSWNYEDYVSAGQNMSVLASNMGAYPDRGQILCSVWHYQHNDANRQFRIELAAGGSSDTATPYVTQNITQGTGLLSIERLGEYADPVTLTP